MKVCELTRLHRALVFLGLDNGGNPDRNAVIPPEWETHALQADAELVGWLVGEGASVVHAPRQSSVDGVLLASRRHALDGITGASADLRRTWAAAEVGGALVGGASLKADDFLRIIRAI